MIGFRPARFYGIKIHLGGCRRTRSACMNRKGLVFAQMDIAVVLVENLDDIVNIVCRVRSIVSVWCVREVFRFGTGKILVVVQERSPVY